MFRRTAFLLAILAVALCAVAAWASTAADLPMVSYSGKIVDAEGKPVHGATVSLFTADQMQSVSVYSQSDGSFTLPEQPASKYRLRARLIGYSDAFADLDSDTDSSQPIQMSLEKATGWELQLQRPADDLLTFLKWDNEADELNFKMMCTYCHQVGTLGFRSPEEPVDWEVMLTRMDGFQGLYKHTQEVLVDKVVAAYGRDAEKDWPEYQPPPPPEGKALQAVVSEWAMGRENVTVTHDLAVASDGVIYTVDMASDAIISLDPATGERAVYSVPGGKEFDSDDRATKGIHSIEEGPDGNLWATLAYSGEMARFDLTTKEWRVVPGNEAPKPRGGYPHTLRFDDDKGVLYWTDAALGVFSLDIDTYDAEANRYAVKYYKLPSADQVRGGGARGESRGVTPYGIDVAPNGHVWYTKLNGQRVGRIAPELADDDPNQILEWKPPVHGPRRLHVAPNGIVWVPGFASGDIASFQPETEEWAVYELPRGPNSLPYALNINPVTGDIWVCGTGTDSMLRFDPEAKEFVEYRMPTRVTYTREIEFDAEGNAWTTNSNGPARHIENGYGAVIKIAVR